MRKHALFIVFWSFLLVACLAGPGADQPPAVGQPSPDLATATPSPTPAPLTWQATALITSPFQVILPNEGDDYQRQEIYGSGVTPDFDVRWTIQARADALIPDVGEASTGLVFLGYAKDGNMQSLFLVYQGGTWNLLYQPRQDEPEFSLEASFAELTDPAQTFELTLSRRAGHLALSTAQGFEFQRRWKGRLFNDAKIIVATAQMGPHTRLTLSQLIVAQRRAQEATPPPDLPPGFVTPTPRPGGNGAPAFVFHVATDGDDHNPGTAAQPFASIAHARAVIRTVNQRMNGPIIVEVHGGTYALRQPLQFDQSDSGQNGYAIIYRAAAGETPILSGGAAVTGWRRVPDSPLWTITVPATIGAFRQLYVNDVRAQRAVASAPIVGLRWAAGDFSARDGIVIEAGAMPNFTRPQDLELHWIYDWKDMRLPVRTVSHSDDGALTIWLKQPYYANALAMEGENGGHAWIPRYDAPFYFENAPELLDQPGEWYFDAVTRTLFYWPRAGEEMSQAEAIIPQATTLLEIGGGAVGQEVHDLVFEGLVFAHAGWTRASEQGTFGWQAQSLIFQTDWNTLAEEMTPAHVRLNSARALRFDHCHFEHLGAAALGLINNVFDVTVHDNQFWDIGDSAVVLGHWEHVQITAPSLQQPAHDNTISNNLIEDVGAEYWGAPAITAYYVHDVQIVHNEIANIPFTGISLGWGWSFAPGSTTAHDNYVAYNAISDSMLRASDGGGLYTLGQQPGTIFERNVVRRMAGEHACLYADEGSAHITFRSNVCDSAPEWLYIWVDTIHDLDVLGTFTNVARMRNQGVNIHISNTTYVNGQNWPPAAQTIIAQAGRVRSFPSTP